MLREGQIDIGCHEVLGGYKRGRYDPSLFPRDSGIRLSKLDIGFLLILSSLPSSFLPSGQRAPLLRLPGQGLRPQEQLGLELAAAVAAAVPLSSCNPQRSQSKPRQHPSTKQ
jgi:hypothetical protein